MAKKRQDLVPFQNTAIIQASSSELAYTKEKATESLMILFNLCAKTTKYGTLQEPRVALDCIKFACQLNNLSDAQTPAINNVNIMQMIANRPKVTPT